MFTIDEALAAVPHLGGVKTKNVFVRDGKGQRHILVIVPHDRRVDMAELGRQLPATRLSMASPDRLQTAIVHALKVDKIEVPKDASAALIGYMINANRIGAATLTATYGR